MWCDHWTHIVTIVTTQPQCLRDKLLFQATRPNHHNLYYNLLATQQPAFSRNSKVQQSLLCPGTAFTADYPKVSLALTAACSTVEVRCIDTECCSCIRELF